ncbi:Outer membrane receptor proteins, mostly Fe transport [Flavobacterium fluvii]|uniref:Outer membrane receptor proteins, mostly Fe transport n=1 Tax=Flavobacterium fluvii TaxID=468056 RepID=A0A1M5HVI8_9FLAO|nr:outer membrane beta-barrel family protein [Flavobacterium fluvii]SHG19893.1 Outer membrane receptor proteins, mostly Fe transport [Flavobacterium fluvii]
MKKKSRIQNTKIIICLIISGFGYGQNTKVNDSISNKLSEVVVTKEKKMFTNKNGNIKVDVANSILNAIPNTIDLLSKLPNITISADKENITVIGKGNPLIYIDNQKIGMNDLNALSVDEIKTIEIINNPSSKYEAEGRAVILITRKFSKKEGSQTTLSEVASFKKEFNNYLGINSSYKKNKFEWKANFNYNKLQPWESHRIDYQIPDADIISNYDVATANTKRKQFIFGGGLFYKINDEDYFSISINSKLQSEPFNINTTTYNKKDDLENNVVTYSDNESQKNFINSFINYSKKIKAIDTQFFTGFQYSNFDQDSKSLAQNNFNDTQFELAQNSDQKFNVAVFSGRADFEKKFKNELKLEYGALYLSANAKTDFEILNFETNNTISSIYNFKEKNSAGYTQLSGSFKKIGYLVGLRVENANIVGKFKNDNAPLINKYYTDFFPKAQFDIPIDSTKSITVNYSKSISRPNYSSTSQGSTYINPYFLYSRNINLNPTINNQISSTFQYHDKSVKLSYYQNTDPVYSSFTFDNQNNILIFREINFEKETGFNLEFTLPFTYKIWTSTNSLSCILNKIEDASAEFITSKPYLYYYSNNEFKLPKGYSFVLTAYGLTNQKEGIFERKAWFIMNLGVSKTFFTNWNCSLSYNDIFRNTIYQESFTINNISSTARYLVDAHEFSIAVKYSFGKIKPTEFKEKNVDDNLIRVK